ncbi:Sphingomyelin phosphodiesterase 2 [Psilocybe cubensis]|uniref:Sphingomyelin phosphodiesterase 2 n=1 Tax=Psilocybe cubensis TaxID=181762 RepID=A0ACB8HF79_PSICU|nr:Sphingomyelin phosphodiesterase 2 [Psilocybe cubensis]KAH9486375.1 Sphingomyelin phosphodiesterase 2 [Psilocybe cubensis]
MLGNGPVYAAVGNHDSFNQAQDAPHAIGGELAQQFSWNYDHLASLWEHEHWLPEAAVNLARTHYAGYMVKRSDGLRIISLNTNLWYRRLTEINRANYFNYINMTNPDTSGMLRFLTDELQDAEDSGDRVWIIGHVISGWDGTNPLRNPTNLFYQIVDRFSPHVIASKIQFDSAKHKLNTLQIFFGDSAYAFLLDEEAQTKALSSTHEDQMSIYYANNGTTMSVETAQTLAWTGPSITPGTNINSGFRLYEVDTATFEILDAHTWISDVNSYPALDAQVALGPTFSYEYNTRQTYGGTITEWGPNDPLNATWWHRVTEAMEADSGLVTVS